jgi:hypothetical protein
MTVKELCDMVADAWGLHDDGTRQTIKRVMQTRYYELCRLAAFQELRDRVNLTFDTTETDGKWLPPHVLGILSVVSTDADDPERYYPTTENRRYVYDGRCHYYHPSTRFAAVAQAETGLNLQPRNRTASCAAAAAAWVNEYITFGGQSGFYKIASVEAGVSLTLSASYYGDQALNDAAYEVRPVGTRKLVIVDDEGELVSDTVTVYYWGLPEPIYHDNQTIRLPETSVLEHLVKADCIGAIEKRRKEADSYLAIAERKMSDLTMLAPADLQPMIPRNKYGQQVVFGRKR